MSSCGEKANIKPEKSVSSSTEEISAENNIWSYWFDNIPDYIKNDSKNYVVESKTEAKTETLYSYRDKEIITTNTPKNTNEWTLLNEPVTNWGNWSIWQRGELKESSTRMVEKMSVPQKMQTSYCYYQYIIPSNPSKGHPSGSDELSRSSSNTYIHISVPKPLYETGTFLGQITYGPYSENKQANPNMWYKATPAICETVLTEAHDEWRYRDVESITYTYYKFTNWSNWSLTETSATSTKEVKTKNNTVNVKMYRYRKI